MHFFPSQCCFTWSRYCELEPKVETCTFSRCEPSLLPGWKKGTAGATRLQHSQRRFYSLSRSRAEWFGLGRSFYGIHSGFFIDVVKFKICYKICWDSSHDMKPFLFLLLKHVLWFWSQVLDTLAWAKSKRWRVGQVCHGPSPYITGRLQQDCAVMISLTDFCPG